MSPPVSSRGPGKGPWGAGEQQDGDWWIGWVEEVPGVNAQESTREGLVASLKVVLQAAPTRS